MRECIYHIAGVLYKITKALLKRNPTNKVNIVWVYDNAARNIVFAGNSAFQINEKSISNEQKLDATSLYYGDNYCINCQLSECNTSVINREKIEFTNSYDAWVYAMNNAIIPDGYKNSGLAKVGFTLDSLQLCLSSWIWTSGKILQYYATHGELDKAKQLADNILARQEAVGGWVVRNDILNNRIVPVLAQNDSAFLANKGLLSLYEISGDKRYLAAAEKCAHWIMKSTREDGLVPTGIDAKTGEALDNRIIVDTGFTAGLFSKLYRLTHNEEYKMYAIDFCGSFIKYFFDTDKKWFATNIDKNYKKHGGSFFRGQAWALEGLIDTYEISKDERIFDTIESVSKMLIQFQLNNGGWSANIERWYMGEDGKGIPIVANLLLRWYVHSNCKEEIIVTVDKAIEWVKNHTNLKGPGCGLIFSYSFEGAISHSFYTRTAMYYSTAYAIELIEMRNKINEDKDNNFGVSCS